jgi:fatty acid desaturase
MYTVSNSSLFEATSSEADSINHHTDADYIRVIRPLLPKEAFQRKPSSVLYFLFWLALVVASIFLARSVTNPVLLVFISLLYGHSIAGLTLFAHNLSHGAVLSQGILKNCLEVISWGLSLIPRTMWIHVHNQTHHPYTGTLKDPDRPWLNFEETWLRKVYSLVFYPQGFKRFPWLFNPIQMIHFVSYISRNIIGVFWTEKSTYHFVPYQKPYTQKERLAVLGELGIIITLQVLLFVSLDCDFRKYCFIGILPPLFASSFLMVYIKTNHFLNPVTLENDSLTATTSVVVHPIFNLLHSNFSYHTEHHLFPSMHSDYYPLVSQLLKQHFPEQYNQIPIGEAWKRLCKRSTFATLTSLQK